MMNYFELQDFLKKTTPEAICFFDKECVGGVEFYRKAEDGKFLPYCHITYTQAKIKDKSGEKLMAINNHREALSYKEALEFLNEQKEFLDG
jgi:hypothetical protein